MLAEQLMVFLNSLIVQFGLLGLFIAAIIANATLFLPVPIDIVVFIMGNIDFLGIGFFSPLVLGVVVGGGAAIGEMSGYIIGLFGMKSIEKLSRREIKRVENLRNRIRRRGMVFIFLGAVTPFPFDLIGLASGLIKYDWKKFFLAALAGKIVRYLLIAYAGYFSIGLVKALFGF